MTSIAVIENKISSIKKYLQILEKYGKYSQKEIENSVDIRGAVERYLYLAVQATIDLAEAFIACEHFRKPITMGDSFHILKEYKIISDELTEKLIKMVGFRSVTAHDYDKINYSIVYSALHDGVKDIKKFLTEISDKI